MLDTRIESFLSVCKNRSYTKAAKELCITQPAVTQHIQLLEKNYGCKLFEYIGRELHLSKAGYLLLNHLQNVRANEILLTQKIKASCGGRKVLSFAATRTIGEFTLSPIMSRLLNTFEDYDIAMYIDNTVEVLSMLQKGEISFALVEGLFNKADYEYRLYKKAVFILTVPVDHWLRDKTDVTLDDLKNETMIVREKGSGSREILERGLFDRNYTLDHFKRIIEIGNVNVIKNLVKKGVGISFMYRDAVAAELKKNEISEIEPVDFRLIREFNFIWLKNNTMRDELEMFFTFFMYTQRH